MGIISNGVWENDQPAAHRPKDTLEEAALGREAVRGAHEEEEP
jgi:hypothetical protein